MMYPVNFKTPSDVCKPSPTRLFYSPWDRPIARSRVSIDGGKWLNRPRTANTCDDPPTGECWRIVPPKCVCHTYHSLCTLCV